MSNGIKLVGDWRKLRKKFDSMARGAVTFESNTMAELADLARDAIHEVVNSSPSPQNAPSTIRRKGFDNPLLEDGGMMEEDSIIVEKGFEKGRIAYVAKGNPNKIHPRSKTSYEDIVEVAENGGGKVPPRFALSIAYSLIKPEIESMAIKRLNEDLFGE